MSAGNIPHEMIMAFIDQLHDDKPALKACSLVCKAWTHPARLHLFSTVTVKKPLQPAVFSYVRRLHLRLGIDSHWHHHAPPRDEVEIIPLLVGFHRVVSLNIVLLFLHYPDVVTAQSWSHLGENFSAVTSLSFDSRTNQFEFDNATSFARMVCAFPRLQKLHMRCTVLSRWTVASQAELSTLRLSPDFHTLDIGHDGIGVVLDWLLSLPTPPALRHIYLSNIEDGDLAAFHKFIPVFGDGLESVMLVAISQDWSHHSMDLTSLSRLRSIAFIVGVDIPRDSRRWITRILSHMCSAHLEEVVFITHLSHHAQNDSEQIPDALEWQNLDAILQRTTFSRLKQVHFSCTNPSAVDLQLSSARTSIMQLLPQCHARGILRVDAVVHIYDRNGRSVLA